MPGRQSPEERKEREDFMLSVFREDPDQSVGKANKKFKGRFGTMLRNSRAYELRAVAQAERTRVANGTKTQPRERTSRPTAGGRCLMIEGTSEHLAETKDLVAKLQSLGIPISIDHETEAYIIIKA